MTNKIPDEILQQCARKIYKLLSVLNRVGIIEQYLHNQWQPIETAPKNGVIKVKYDNIEYYATWFKEAEGWAMCTEKGRKLLFSDTKNYCEIPATHWRPLPHPPKGEK